jgi:predicted Zn-ribbon and HTH transcriptional regulator
MEKCMCLRCSYAWVARVENPVVCPRCKARDWREGKKKRAINQGVE